MRKSVGFLGLILVMLMFAGCLGAGIAITITPNPIELTFGDDSTEVTINVRTQGFGSLRIDSIIAELIDEDEQVVDSHETVLDLTLPVVPGLTHPEVIEIRLPEEYVYPTEEEYNKALLGKSFKVNVSITGSNPVQSKALVKFL